MNVVAKKSLGQNFLIDEKILNLIVSLGNINSNDIVLEVGPGTGNLTNKLIDPIVTDKADVVYGSRFLSNEKGQRILYYWHRVGNFLLTTLTNI